MIIIINNNENYKNKNKKEIKEKAQPGGKVDQHSIVEEAKLLCYWKIVFEQRKICPWKLDTQNLLGF